MSKPNAADDEAPELHPNEIVRFAVGCRKFFGYGPSQIHEKIKAGEIPTPMRLSDGGRALGWTGQQILEHQRRLKQRAEVVSTNA